MNEQVVPRWSWVGRPSCAAAAPPRAHVLDLAPLAPAPESREERPTTPGLDPAARPRPPRTPRRHPADPAPPARSLRAVGGTATTNPAVPHTPPPLQARPGTREGRGEELLSFQCSKILIREKEENNVIECFLSQYKIFRSIA